MLEAELHKVVRTTRPVCTPAMITDSFAVGYSWEVERR
ncbi:unnamed protein product, partial [Nippostrongylus brasiliensis]|uniref:OmpR/PhoB-type domain-containing protein n=1 Tax=Nippostrongylus brasiliensis TaxID=27835 RepID=A0A0N4XJQ8_NIPBR